MLSARSWGTGPPEVVLLHDGLGSISQWRAVPEAIHDATGRTVLAYERAGHGSSTPVPTGPWPADWLHHEAVVLADLLDSVGAEQPVLVGHSDGGSISLLAAAEAGVVAAGVVSLAAHSWVEQVCVDAIAEMRETPDRFVAGLARHHEHPAAVFEAWSGVWTGDDFRPWDVRGSLATITAPVHVVQGEADEYASPEHVAATVDAIGPNARGTLLPGRGHLLHHEAPDVVVELIAGAVTDWLG
ncbi:MAG: alpha/beta hydrolase [Actinomycetota bacterium]